MLGLLPLPTFVRPCCLYAEIVNAASAWCRGQRWIPKAIIFLASLVAVLGAAMVLVSGADLKRDLNVSCGATPFWHSPQAP